MTITKTSMPVNATWCADAWKYVETATCLKPKSGSLRIEFQYFVTIILVIVRYEVAGL